MIVEFDVYARFLFGLIFVLGLIAALFWTARRFNLVPGALRVSSGSVKRLSIVEIAAVDTKRRLVLVRRDNTEHLLLLGANSEIVVETIDPASVPEDSRE